MEAGLSKSRRFQGRFDAEFVHPLLVRGTYTDCAGHRKDRPDIRDAHHADARRGVVDTERVSGTNQFGVLWPLFRFDGRTTMVTQVGSAIASMAYPAAASGGAGSTELHRRY